MPTVKPNIFDGETARPMTDAEYAQWQADNAETETKVQAEAKAEAERATQKQAVLDRLGITAAEAALLIG